MGGVYIKRGSGGLEGFLVYDTTIFFDVIGVLALE
jgi:hypothetical protein